MTLAPGTRLTVVYRRTGGVDETDAIDEYSRRLADALGALGIEADYAPNGLSSILDEREQPDWVLLQYNPFRYGRAGFAPRLIRDAVRLRRGSDTRLAVMVHEAWIDMIDAKSTAIGLWQRAQLRTLLRLADIVTASTEALAKEIGHHAVHIPNAATIPPISTSSLSAREHLGVDGQLTVALFGTNHPSRALGHAERAIAALVAEHGAERLVVLNLGDGAPRLRVPNHVQVIEPGRLSADELSLRLWASDLVLLPFSDGVSTRRTTLMAALAHGRPVLALQGRNTDALLTEAQDALVLTPVADPDAFAGAAVRLTADPERLRATGDAAKRLYESHFDWPVLASSVNSVVGCAPPRGRGFFRRRRREPRKPDEVMFVAHDVGGSGGMERHTEELITRLLGAGLRVTVVARTCKLESHAGLRFIRVRAPSRPFPIAYPAFFVLGSLRAARRGGALLHTTGAIVVNRTDICTVHYCHMAAAGRVEGSRASRPGRLYALNAAVAGILSRAGEKWCYRPGRIRVLCAVSAGVASELQQTFPAMYSAVRTIPNGVDTARFRPDPRARQQVRAELDVDDDTRLALFVGGDWERKGLSYAVDALANAPGWKLVVAGAGDREPLAARARAAGTESRVRFLGSVDNMPRLYAAGDAFILPTAYEAFPLVALEAAASAVPLLATPVNGVQDLLEDGRAGWFIAPDGEDIARRLNELRSDPQLARDMAEHARAAVAGYSWDAMAHRYVALYTELANGS